MKAIIPYLISLLAVACAAPEKRAPEDERQINQQHMDSTGYALVNGIRMYYEVHGQGMPLVLIHGGGSTINTTFGRIIPVLAKEYQLIAVELQAHGHTADRATPLSFEQDADDVAALLDQLGIDSAVILGFSNGGTTALQLAVRHPQKVSKLIAASALFKRKGAPAAFWEFMQNGSFEQMPDAYKTAFLEAQADTALLYNMYQKCGERMRGFEDITDEQIRSVKVPVLLLNGTEDVATTAHMQEISQLLPQGRLVVFPGGHGTYLGEITTWQQGADSAALPVIPVIKQFLQEQE